MNAQRFLANACASVLVALTLVWVGAPAQAAACEKGTGTTVVVQGHGMNSTRCTGKVSKASDAFESAGFPLTYTTRFPGFVCRVSGKPASDPCHTASPADAYWGLFWADGKGGGWKYADKGVTQLSIPEGGWVAFRFQDGDGKKYPSANPVGPAPKPTPKPTVKPTPKPTVKPTSKPSGTPSASPTTSTATSATPTPGGTPSASATPGSTPSTDAPAAAGDESAGDSTDKATAGVSTSADDDAGSGPGVWTFIALGLLASAGGLIGWRVWKRR
jgi:hypothetical protein